METKERLDFERVRQLLEQLLERQTVKQWYSVEEFARLTGKAAFTVRQWCLHGRVRAERSMTRAGPSRVYAISHDEYLRYQREGLLPRFRGPA